MISLPWACHKALHRQFLPFFPPLRLVYVFFFLDLFLFFKKFILLFSIVDLQCCIKFCCTEKWLSYTYVHMYILSHILFCHGLSQVIEYSFLCYTVGPCGLSIIYTIVYCCWLCNPMALAHQAPPIMGFPRQEYWAGCHSLLQGIFPNQGSNPCLLHWQVDSLPLKHQGSLDNSLYLLIPDTQSIPSSPWLPEVYSLHRSLLIK